MKIVSANHTKWVEQVDIFNESKRGCHLGATPTDNRFVGGDGVPSYRAEAEVVLGGALSCNKYRWVVSIEGVERDSNTEGSRSFYGGFRRDIQ
jgi:hypothetical protein